MARCLHIWSRLGSNQQKIYINGALHAQKTQEADIGGVLNTYSATRFLYLGAPSGTAAGAYVFKGMMSNFMYFVHSVGGTPLNLTQVQELYNSGEVYNYATHSRYSDVKGWWKLDGNGYDYTSNTRPADLYGSPSGLVTARTLYKRNSGLPPITTTEVASNSFRVNSSQKENTLPFVFGVAGRPSLRHAPQVP